MARTIIQSEQIETRNLRKLGNESMTVGDTSKHVTSINKTNGSFRKLMKHVRKNKLGHYHSQS